MKSLFNARKQLQLWLWLFCALIYNSQHPKKGLEEMKQKNTQNHSACFKTPLKNSNIPYVIWKSVVFHSIELWSELERNFFDSRFSNSNYDWMRLSQPKKTCGQIMTMYFYFLIEVKPKWEPEIWRCPSLLLELVNWY